MCFHLTDLPASKPGQYDQQPNGNMHNRNERPASENQGNQPVYQYTVPPQSGNWNQLYNPPNQAPSATPPAWNSGPQPTPPATVDPYGGGASHSPDYYYDYYESNYNDPTNSLPNQTPTFTVRHKEVSHQ
ncbi:hypothetical protein Ciccas_001801 [Cichlidogyrus casuarinus]|uniref:Uncharacterized protein n=1 Tax=Cichlidogyrus casuarinus TaxID=1844966 RepID=A0ABD2QJ03_9PLAT